MICTLVASNPEKVRVRTRYGVFINKGPDEKENHSCPCRILIRFEGVEWVMYNRTMVFDDVLRKAQEGSKGNVHGSNEPGTFPPIQDQVNGPSQETGQEAQVTEATLNSAPGQPERYPPFAFRIAQPIADLPSRLWGWLMSLLPSFDFSDLLPIEFEAKNGAIILGNHSMKTRFIISFRSGTGTYSVAPVRVTSIEGNLLTFFFSVAQNTTNTSNCTISTSARSLSRQKRTKIIITTW